MNLTNLTRLKIRGRLFIIRGISLLLILFFLSSNLTFAQTFQAEKNTLARYSFMQLVKEANSEDFNELVSKLAKSWVADIATKVQEAEGKITLYDAVVELKAQIEKWAEEANMPTAKTARIVSAVITEAAKLLEEPTVERDRLKPNIREYVTANLRNIRTKLPKDVDTEKILDILTIFKQNPVTEGSVVHLQMDLLRLGVPKSKLLYILDSITLGTVPGDRPVIKKILIVEDDLRSREVDIELLEKSAGKAKLEIVEAGSVEEAKKALEESIKSKSPFDLIITNGDLRRATGIDVAIAVRALPVYKDTPIILHSGYTQYHIEELYEKRTGEKAPQDIITTQVFSESLFPAIQQFGTLGAVEKSNPGLTILPPQTVIPNVEDLTKQVATHMFLRPEGRIDLSKIAIVMNKNLPNIFSNEKNAILKETLVQEYNKMIIDLNKHYCDGKGIIKVDPDEDDVPGVVNGLIDKGLKVIVLGDKILTEKILGHIKGKASEDYCVVHLAADERNLDGNSIYYLNLNAMTLIGTAILHNDEILFKTAYRLFVGVEPEEITITSFRARALWIINVLPRIIKFTGELRDRKELQRVFSVSV